jgi:hypothetical protein
VNAALLGVLCLKDVTGEGYRCSFVLVRVLLNGVTQCGSVHPRMRCVVCCACAWYCTLCVDDVVCTRDKSGVGTHCSIDGATHTRRVVFRERCRTV